MRLPVRVLRCLILMILCACGARSKAPTTPSSPPRRITAPASLEQLACPIEAQASKPTRPEVINLLGLLRREMLGCLDSCKSGEHVDALLRITPDGKPGEPTLVDPVAGCFTDHEVQSCIAARWAQVCFEPSTDGVEALFELRKPEPEPEAKSKPKQTARVPSLNIIYPTRAALAGVGGYVRLRFDVGEDGTTQNIVVIESVPAGVFDASARAAVQRWRYPNDEGRAHQGLMITLPYRLSGRPILR